MFVLMQNKKWVGTMVYILTPLKYLLKSKCCCFRHPHVCSKVLALNSSLC